MEAKTLEMKFVEMADKMADAVGKFGGLQEQVAEAMAGNAAVRVAMADAQKETALQMAELRAYLSAKYGKEGAADWRRSMKVFLCNVMSVKRGEAVPDWAKMDAPIQKADYTTTTGATAGYMVPEVLMSDIMAIAEIHGTLYPRLSKATVPAGSVFKVNGDLALPTAGWRVTQGSDMSESGPTLQQSESTTALIGSFVKIANELIDNPNSNIIDYAVVRMISAIVRAIEIGVMQGDDSVAHPADGVLVATGVNSQTAISDSTIAKFLAFIAECAVDHEGSYNAMENLLVVSPAKVLAMASDALGATGLGGVLTWGDPQKGIPPACFGYPIIGHPGALITATHYATMINPKVIVVGESGRYSVDLNPFGTGWASNESWLRVFTHATYSMGVPDAHHKASYV